MSPLAHRRLVCLVAIYVLALIALGVLLHPVAIDGGENDFYVERADRLLAGELANDRFHGMLYPLLVAAATWLAGDAFAAGRIVSSLGAGLLVYALHRGAHARHGAAVANWSTVLLLANAPFALLGVQAASDMVGAAFLVTALWRLQVGTTRFARAVAGACLGLAIATRPSLLPLAALFLPACWQSGAAGAAAGWRGAAAFLLGTGLGCLPHGLLTALQFGSPFANENWRVLESKVAGWDTVPLDQPNHKGLFDVLAREGGELCRLGLRDFGATWSHHVGAWITGRSSLPGVPVAWSALAIAATAHAVWARRRAWLEPAVVVGYSLLVAFTFAPGERALLPMAPILVPLAVALLLRLRPAALGHGAVAAWVALVLLAVPGCWSAFARSHPTAELAAVARLQRERGPTLTVVGTYPQLARHGAVRAMCVASPVRYTPTRMWQAVLSVAGGRADCFVTSPATFWQPLAELVAAAPAGTEVVQFDATVLVVRLPRTAIAWLEQADVVCGEQQFELTVRTLAVDGLLGAGFTVFPPAGPATVLPLLRVGPQEFRGTLPIPLGGRSGTWRFVPGCMLLGDEIHEGRAIERVLP